MVKDNRFGMPQFIRGGLFAGAVSVIDYTSAHFSLTKTHDNSIHCLSQSDVRFRRTLV